MAEHTLRRKKRFIDSKSLKTTMISLRSTTAKEILLIPFLLMLLLILLTMNSRPVAWASLLPSLTVSTGGRISRCPPMFLKMSPSRLTGERKEL
uniref:JHL18I08.3 protein n=1 Tax=Rhizophora mucronata TaxID=61149 RepID=A0A2P2JU89_RHIMU